MSLILYHFPSAICAQKVRLALAEKGLNFESRDVLAELRSPEYLKLNPSGVVPTLVHDSNVLTESRIISEYIDEAFPDPPLMPADPIGRHRVRYWSKMVDDSLHLNVFILSFAIALRPIFVSMPEDVRMQRMPGLADPLKRGITLDLLANGFASPHVATARARFVKLIDAMEAALAEQPWLAGDNYTLADVDLTAYAARLAELGLAALWHDRPVVTDWIARAQARPSFKAAILDWRTDAETAGHARNAAAVRAEPSLTGDLIDA